ncbi:MAG TPA: hypothetical protein VMH31_06710, partial [Methylomirabilota bacterium]|nr:hypothetical protein [Methylomirabilota bacterium]
VNKLREALCDSPEKPRYIETLPRRGYRFIGEVEQLEDVVEPAETLPALPPAPAPAAPDPAPTQRVVALVDEGWQSSVPVKRQTLVDVLGLVMPLALVAVGLAGFFWPHSSPSPQEIERFQKQGVEIAEKQLREKQQDEIRGPAATVLYAAKDRPAEVVRAEDAARRKEESLKSTENSHPPSTSDPSSEEQSFLLRLTGNGRRLGILREVSTDQKPSILKVDLHHLEGPNSVSKIVGGWDAIAGPQPSPDGKRLVFSAGRTDSGEVWVSNIDGSSPRMLTNLSSAGTPRWSPDSRWIAFDSDGRYGHSAIFVVSVDGGPVHAIVQDEANNSVPSWSRDGKYIYFASNRGTPWESDEVWKVPFSGGPAVQITHHGGFSAFESFDGQTLYYAKSRYQNPEIWQAPVNGGNESRVALLHPSTWASWAVTKTGILLLSEYESSASQLEYFDFASRSIHSLAALEKASFWLAASADGSTAWYSELTDSQARQVFTASMN